MAADSHFMGHLVGWTGYSQEVASTSLSAEEVATLTAVPTLGDLLDGARRMTGRSASLNQLL